MAEAKPVLRSVATVMSGTAAAQIVMLISAPILARLYSPQDLGAFSVIVAIATSTGAVSALKWDAAVPLPSSDREASALLTLGCLSVALTTLAIAAATFVLGEQLAHGLNLEEPRLLVAAPVISGLTGLILLLTQWAIRQHQYGATARRAAAQASVAATLQCSAPLAGTAAVRWGLLTGYALGQVAGLWLLMRGASLRGTPRPRSWRDLTTTARRYGKLSLTLTPAALLNAAGLQLPVVLLAIVYSSEISGWFGMTHRAVSIPAAILGVAIAQVFLGEFATLVRDDPKRAVRLYRRARSVLAVVGVTLTAILAVFGPLLFEVFLGAAWRESGHYARFLAPAIGLQLASSPLASVLTVLERPGVQFLLDTVRVVALAAITWLVQAQGSSPRDAVILISLVICLFYAMYWTAASRAVRTLASSINEG